MHLFFLFSVLAIVQDNAVVMVRIAENVGVAASVHLEPCGSNDWEILQIHADYLEEHLLDQTYVLFRGQVLICTLLMQCRQSIQ